MDDNKEKELDGAVPENDAQQNEPQINPNEAPEDVKKEMEELARTFQEELDKAKAEAKAVAENPPEEPQILIQDLEDIPKPSENLHKEDISEEELCECCGEKRRGTKKNPDSPYCADCERGLRHYPFEFLSVLIAIIVLGFSFYACYVFADYSEVYVAAEKADKYVAEGKLYTAYDAYTSAADIMADNSVNGEMVYKRSLLNIMKLGGIDEITSFSSQFKSWELKFPHLKAVGDAFKFTEEFNAAADEGYNVLYKYFGENEDFSQVDFDALIAELDALESKAVEPNTVTDEEGETVTTTAPYGITAAKYERSMLLYLKFYAATVCEKDYSVRIGFLEQIKNEYPDLVWLYNPMLGDLYAKSGADVTEYCNYIRSINSEDSSADVIEATALRIKGDYDGCVKICNEKISESDDYSYEFYRQIALCNLIKGEYTAAYENAQKSYEQYSGSVQICDTLALCAAAVGNEETYAEMESLFEGSGYTLSDEVTQFKAGTLSLEKILTEGDYDVE